MKPFCYVGFDTSNYTTSVAACAEDGTVIANLKSLLPVRQGQCGLRQSDAVFEHTRNLPALIEQLGEMIREYSVAGVACSVRPRDAEDSYMPCFLVGKLAATSFATAKSAELHFFSHQDGHLMAAVCSSGVSETLLQSRFASFHISGGTTELLLATPSESGFSVERIGGTADLNAGQAIDRAGVMMGLPFPAGKYMEELAGGWNFEIPPVSVAVKDLTCHFSGLQNLSEKLWEETKDAALVSQFVFSFVGKTLEKLTGRLDERCGRLPVVYAGGVMSNGKIKEMLSKRGDCYFAQPAFSSDNAAGIAWLCRRKMMR